MMIIIIIIIIIIIVIIIIIIIIIIHALPNSYFKEFSSLFREEMRFASPTVLSVFFKMEQIIIFIFESS